jgi:DNA-binding PadR family transcriptional regulator
MKLISRQEEILLLTIWRLVDNAYGVTIREHVSGVTKKYWSIGAIYDILDRLARKGLVTTTISDPIAERGGKSRRYYTLTKEGHESLEHVRNLQANLWDNLPDTATE